MFEMPVSTLLRADPAIESELAQPGLRDHAASRNPQIGQSSPHEPRQ
jgi:hypothetical protein